MSFPVIHPIEQQPRRYHRCRKSVRSFKKNMPVLSLFFEELVTPSKQMFCLTSKHTIHWILIRLFLRSPQIALSHVEVDFFSILLWVEWPVRHWTMSCDGKKASSWKTALCSFYQRSSEKQCFWTRAKILFCQILLKSWHFKRLLRGTNFWSCICCRGRQPQQHRRWKESNSSSPGEISTKEFSHKWSHQTWGYQGILLCFFYV